MLVTERAQVVICDPQALANARLDLADLGDRVAYEPDPYAAVSGADALAILTDWTCFRTLDFERVYRGMRQPAFLFDGRNCVNHAALYQLGFNVYAVGKPPRSHLA
jgi:UDPglucose 6-dehydrogenase